MYVNKEISRNYEKWTLGQAGKTNPIQTQFKPNSNPIQTQYKANQTQLKPIKAQQMPKQTQFKPKQTQFHINFRGGNK
ncbi:MAG: hypothetical protein ACYS91_04460 [Planctomycetota bacterium]|jgi:hypothetical protein